MRSLVQFSWFRALLSLTLSQALLHIRAISSFPIHSLPKPQQVSGPTPTSGRGVIQTQLAIHIIMRCITQRFGSAELSVNQSRASFISHGATLVREKAAKQLRPLTRIVVPRARRLAVISAFDILQPLLQIANKTRLIEISELHFVELFRKLIQ